MACTKEEIRRNIFGFLLGWLFSSKYSHTEKWVWPNLKESTGVAQSKYEIKYIHFSQFQTIITKLNLICSDLANKNLKNTISNSIVYGKKNTTTIHHHYVNF